MLPFTDIKNLVEELEVLLFSCIFLFCGIKLMAKNRYEVVNKRELQKKEECGTLTATTWSWRGFFVFFLLLSFKPI